MDLGLNGRTCAVTGASSGLGLAIARALSREGATVVLIARGEEALQRAVAGCPGARALPLDITDPQAPDRLLAAGQIDVLVNSAGTSALRTLEELTEADWQAQWELHVMAPMRLMRALAPAMAERGWGRIVNISSSSGKRPSATNMAYSVTKAAMLSLSRSFAELYAGRGVVVNALTPGPVASEMWLKTGGLADQQAAVKGITREQALAAAAGKLPRGELGRPEEIAGVAALLCSELAANVVGAAWSVDGGAVPGIL